jgi:multidrug transporter EmrE-like cation transporter
MIKNIIIFFITTTLLVVGQALWKISSGQLTDISGIKNIFLKLIVNLPFITGCSFYIIATGLWIYLLGQYDYSKIYPIFVGTCIILSLIVGLIFFKENTGVVNKIIGSVVILCGVVIVTKG